MATSDRRLLAESLYTLQLCGCQFSACPGPDKRPVHMLTCHVCRMIRRLRRVIPERERK